jgi:hypothetical protein
VVAVIRAAVALSLALMVGAVALDLHDVAEYPIAPAFTLVGALIASKRRANPIGWLYLAFGVIASIVLFAFAYGWHTLATDPGSLPGGQVAATIAAHLWHPAFGLIIASVLLFPNGRLLTPRWRWALRATVAISALMLLTGIFESKYLTTELGLPGARPLFDGELERLSTPVFGSLLGATVLMLLVAACSLLLRLHRARGEERQQVKWFVYTVTCVMFSVPLSLLVTGVALGVALLPLIPISAAVAILKYRLYDIDVVVKRTLIYGALTAVLGGAYVGGVLVLQLVLSPSSDLAIAGSTLAVAALFRPLRTRIQALVNRRFYRSAYDAARTVEQFGAQLRDEVSLEALSEDLRAVVVQTMHPTHVSLWLR